MARTDQQDKGVNEQPFWTRAQQLEKQAPCQVECPNSGNVRGWLGIIAQRRKHGLSLEQAYDKAWEELVQLNPFPATIGRICPHPCETRCTREGKDGAVSINALERFLGDWAIDRKLPLPRVDGQRYTESIGVIGSGPAGLSFAYQMARRGYSVTLYEKRDQPGGMLRHAIPDYRLPRKLVEAEIQRVLDLSISVVNGLELGKDISLEELRQRHRLLFLGMGAQGARRLGIEGEAGPGVIPGIVYLRQRKLGMKTGLGSKVVVIGGGNTAIDAARSARREGASVEVLYRRTRQEMPAAAHEVDDAITEGVQFTFGAVPCKVLRDGRVMTGVEYRHKDAVESDEIYRLSADSMIVAISQRPDWQGLNLARDGSKWLLTEEDGKLADDIWAGGDDRGPGIASRSVAHGRLAAEAAHAQLRGEPRPVSRPVPPAIDTSKVKTDYYTGRVRGEHPRRPQEQWLDQPDQEIDQTISSEQACKEAERCLSCGLCFDCYQCVMYCNAGGFSPVDDAAPGRYYTLALDACEGCGKCIELCPCGYLEDRDGAPWAAG
jgi:NADPH-dependent glutamate synthase beta subunit-like oxidoreductase/NAD-dependent dihydropyrimidine dehydrogenase PreA subunit